jgi:hypothetical protein
MDRGYRPPAHGAGALGTGTTRNFIGQFSWEVNYQSGKAINAGEAALLLSWGNDLYARTP